MHKTFPFRDFNAFVELQGQRRADHVCTSQVDWHSSVGAVKIDISVRGCQLANEITVDVGDGAVHVLRVGNELGARGEDLYRYADWAAGEGVVEVDCAAVQGSNNGCVSTSLIVDEGNCGCRGGAALWCWSWQGCGCGSEESGDGGECGLHFDVQW